MAGRKWQHVARALAAAGLMLAIGGAALADPPVIVPPAPPLPTATDSPSTNPPAPVQPTPPPANPNANALAMASPPTMSNYSSAPAYSLASVPNMLGDVLGPRYIFAGAGNVPLAAGDRGAKIADDSRPLPTDRVFFDYNYFSQANVTANGAVIGLDRYTFGFEKTFFDGVCSIELKAPIDTGLNPSQNSTDTTSQNAGTVFGDLQIIPKVLLFETCDWALAAGVTIEAPTAPSVTFLGLNGEFTRITDEAVHVAPFLGLQATPTDRLFSIAYLQLDVDAGGDRLVTTQTAPPPIQRGTLRDQTLMYVDWSTGYWLFHDTHCGDGSCGCRRYLTGVAPIIELHYTTALQDAHPVANVFPLSQRVDIFNLTAAAEFELGRCSNLAIGCAAPLRNSPRDKEFGTELIVQFNRRF
jgi:hypothetical protein